MSRHPAEILAPNTLSIRLAALQFRQKPRQRPEMCPRVFIYLASCLIFGK
ncbi:hypothetical protein R2A130_0260 [Ahrensia sp. R2A130]|nr:hypothetical protein R2A130_0260 [Ahrensia sp. R2A130]